MRTASYLHRLTVVTAAMISLPVLAAAQEACTTYTVKDGDTLGSIAQAAYGTFDYQNIFNANRDALAANPNSLPAGLQLILPCADGRLTPDQDLSSVIESETQKQETSKPKSNVYEPPLKFVTSNNAVVSSSGWPQPRCSVAATTGTTPLPMSTTGCRISTPSCPRALSTCRSPGKRRIARSFSLPIYEAAYTFNTLPDSKYANARSFDEYAGAKICRPEAWPLGDLEVQGLTPPVVEYVQPKDPLDCANLLMKGEVDIYSIETETSVANFKELGVTDKVVTNPAIATFISYHFLTAKSNPRGRVYIAMLNRGITEMRESGEWYDIVATGLEEYNKLKP